MAVGHPHVPRWALPVVGGAVLLGFGTALSACSNSAAPASQVATSAGPVSETTPATDPVAAKAAADRAKATAAANKAAAAKAAAKQNAAIRAAAARFLANQASGERAAARAHPIAKAAAACGVPVGYLQAGPKGSRIGPPDVPKPGDMWRVKAVSPVSPGMIIYWPDGGSVLCR